VRYIGKRDIAKIDRWAVMGGAALIAERTGFFQSVGWHCLIRPWHPQSMNLY
jgi:hypothetical protein